MCHMSVPLRERKKVATRQALHEAVLSLTLARGLDAVTVEAIADEANVSRRTFSNYFASKEEALLYGDEVHSRRLLEELRSRPHTEPPWRSLTASARTIYSRLDELGPTWLAQLRLVRQHPSLLARQSANHTALAHDLAEELRHHLPADQDPVHARLLAAIFLTTIRTALAQWSEQPRGSASSAVARALTLAARSFS